MEIVVKRKMPKHKEIYNHWQNELGLADYDSRKEICCWACTYPVKIERCHITPKCLGGSDSVENIILLCKSCHHRQESICETEKGRNRFMELLKEGPFYLPIRLAEFRLIDKLGMTPSNL